MKKSQHNSSTSLFLMEMILALLFLSLCSAACIQIFAAARKNRSFLLFFRMAHRPTTA